MTEIQNSKLAPNDSLFRISSFEFVSDFDIRYSDFPFNDRWCRCNTARDPCLGGGWRSGLGASRARVSGNHRPRAFLSSARVPGAGHFAGDGPGPDWASAAPWLRLANASRAAAGDRTIATQWQRPG